MRRRKGRALRISPQETGTSKDAIPDTEKETEHLRANMMAERVELERRMKEVGMPTEPTTEMAALLEEPDYVGALPSEPQGIPAALDAAIHRA